MYFPTNEDVVLVGYEDDVGIGTVQGHQRLNPLCKYHVVRFWFANCTKKGEKYLQGKKCITSRATHSSLYVLHPKELKLARHNGQRKVHHTRQEETVD